MPTGFSDVDGVFIVPIFDVFWAIQFLLLIYLVLIFTHVFSIFLLLVLSYAIIKYLLKKQLVSFGA